MGMTPYGVVLYIINEVPHCMFYIELQQFRMKPNNLDSIKMTLVFVIDLNQLKETNVTLFT